MVRNKQQCEARQNALFIVICYKKLKSYLQIIDRVYMFVNKKGVERRLKTITFVSCDNGKIYYKGGKADIYKLYL